VNCYENSDTAVIFVDKTGQEIHDKKQRLFDLQDIQRAASNEISAINRSISQLEKEHAEALTSFICHYMRTKFGIQDMFSTKQRGLLRSIGVGRIFSIQMTWKSV